MKKIYAFILLIIVLTLYIAIPSVLSINTRREYLQFSYADWNNYPIVRQVMYKGIKKDLKIIGRYTDEVIKLLGEPDERNAEFLRYKSKPGYIEVIINDDKVIDIVYISPLD